MARTRFLPDRGLTARMTLVMFLLGALFVALVVGLMLVLPHYAWLIGIAGIGVAFYQWWSSDKVAMRAMRAREVTPEEAPELHGMIDRLCAMADMPKPRVGVADLDLPNAFATGRSPDRAVVCVTTGILDRLTAEELEGVLAHELSHVAHRDVLVMTVAASAGILAGMLTRGAQYGGMFGGNRRSNNNNTGGLPIWLVVLVVSLVVYAVSFLLMRLLSRYRELCADRAGAYLTMKPAALASALQKITGEMAAIPQKDLRASSAMNAFFIAPAISGASLRSLSSTHPSLEQRLEQLARIQAELGVPRDEADLMGFWETITGRSAPKQANLDALFAVPGAAITLQAAAGLTPTGDGAVCYRAAGGAAFQQTQDDVVALLDHDPQVPDVTISHDDFGFTWLLAHRDPTDTAGLCTDLHAVNTSLEEQGFGTGLLCSLVPFADASGRRVGLVYLYKQGTFYPFAPTGPAARDNLLEIEVRDQLAGELPMERDLGRWMALWGAPGL